MGWVDADAHVVESPRTWDFLDQCTERPEVVAVMDWTTHRVLAWRLSNTLDARFCVEALMDGVLQYPRASLRLGGLHPDRDLRQRNADGDAG